MSIREMADHLRMLAEKEIGTGASDQDIADSQREIDVIFPASYKTFLALFGWARVYHDPIYGVGPSCPEPYALVRHVLLERTECEPNIPHHLVPIMNDGAGNHYCLDTSRFHGGECPIVFWDHEHWDGPDQSPEEVSPSFDRWLINRITESWRSDNA
jgi:SMI1-KNR4 cell-wall